MSTTRISVACFLAILGLAAQPALAQFETGFESNEGYVGAPGSAGVVPGPSQLVPQNGWFKQFGNNFDVHTYDGAQIPWTPPSSGPELYPVAPKTMPVNPNGGGQFIALGTSDSSTGGRDQIAVTFPAGLVEVSIDFANASEQLSGKYPSPRCWRAYGWNLHQRGFRRTSVTTTRSTQIRSLGD